MAVKIRLLAVAFLALVGVSYAAGPLHAHQVDARGWYECDRGFVMQSRQRGAVCVPESEVSHGPEVILSGVPSAGDGARHLECEASRSQAGGYAAPEASGAQPAPASLFIQTDRPWTVVLDAAGNPSTVIVGGPESRRAPSALFGR